MQFNDPEFSDIERQEQEPDGSGVKKGLYIAIEGPDGAGKTLACQYIKEYFSKASKELEQVNILSTHENSLALRKILTDPETVMHPRTELAYYIAAVLNSLTELVGPATDKGVCVLSDRGPDSSLVYQCLSYGKSDPVMLEMHNAAFAGLQPDITIYLSPKSVEQGLERCIARDGELDRLELRGSSFQTSVLNNYRLVYGAKHYRGEKVFWIENDSDKETLKERIEEALNNSGVTA